MIDIIGLMIVYFTIFYKRWKKKGVNKLIINTLMYIYLSMVLYVTLMPIIPSLPTIFNHPYKAMSMIPFDDYLSGRGDTVRQIVLNVIMMIPFGFLLPIVKKQSLVTSLMWTFLLSLSIELIQPLINSYRASDITDLITNTIGGLIGYLIYRMLRPFILRIIKH